MYKENKGIDILLNLLISNQLTVNCQKHQPIVSDTVINLAASTDRRPRDSDKM